ncbi:MAG: ComF family protein [Butyribacter sp.]|nr:ComF family protein [bacterium]MDY3853617.1 ComF family protein [Butyribacter sp.]
MSEVAGNEGGNILSTIKEIIWQMLYPKRCVICDQILESDRQYLCRHCENIPQYIGRHYCLKCGKPVGEEEEYCRECKGRETSYLCGRAVFLYDTFMQTSISRFKYQGRQEYAAYYARQMYQVLGEWIEQTKADALIPVPIHKKRRRKRGFNQAEVLAEQLSGLCCIPVLEDFLIRTRNTLPQKELTQKERMHNLEGAFQINAKQEEKLNRNMKCVIIVDDIFTTGSTIESCSKVLKSYGVERIYFLSICTGYGF